jgi:hypothetical protein
MVVKHPSRKSLFNSREAAAEGVEEAAVEAEVGVAR